MTAETRTYLKSLRDSKRWNIDLGPLLANGSDVAGIVLHDEFSPLDKARHKLEKMDDFEIYQTNPTKRFRAIVVDFHRDRVSKRVLLLETGMGSMNASLAIYELAAGLLDRPLSARRVLKVGTCSGLYAGERAGTVLVPRYALADEGATKWNSLPKNEELGEWLKKRFDEATKSEATSANPELTKKWCDHLRKRWPDCLGDERGPEWWSSFRNRHDYQPDSELDAAIWSIDNFHGVRSIAPNIYDRMDKWVTDSHPNRVPVAFENECSSHYSACLRADLKIAAALVVSWSCNHVKSFVLEGMDTREASVKTSVHDAETDIIVEAVNFLLLDE